MKELPGDGRGACAAPGLQRPVRSRFLHRALKADGFECLPEPVYLIEKTGIIVEANSAGLRLLSDLPSEGDLRSVGRRELSGLFARAASRELGAAPFRIETHEGVRHYEARFAPSSICGLKAVFLSDVTVWKRALLEKEALLQAARSERERPITVCARCGAIKNAAGAWGPAGALLAANLPLDRLSHGLCTACLAEELVRAGLAQSAIAAAVSTQRRP
jgi:hypothetical protein